MKKPDLTGDAQLVEVLAHHRFNETALAGYLACNLPDFQGPITVRQFQGGQSNPTFLIEDAATKFVLRKKPPGKLLPSAHSVEREFRVLRALQGSEVPVPRARLLCEDPAVIGTAFYVMDYIEGRVISSAGLNQLDPQSRRAVFREYANIAARLHRVDYEQVGLQDFGKPEGFVARQVSRWTKQYVASKVVDNADMTRLMEWLVDNVPQADESAIVHGDLRLGNMIIDAEQPRILALLDWELATLGHPISDVAYACMQYHIPASANGAIGLLGLDLDALGIPQEDEFLAMYCQAAGRERVDNFRFFLAFSCFRMAAITAGVYARALQGNAADRRALEYDEVSRLFAATGRGLVEGRAQSR